MPLMSVWPVSLSAFTLNVGSSSWSTSRASPSLSRSAPLSGSIDWLTTASAKVIDSSTIGCCVSQRVSPVLVSFRPMTATMSPAGAASTSSSPRLGSAWTWKSLATFSFLSLVGLRAREFDRRTPE